MGIKKAKAAIFDLQHEVKIFDNYVPKQVVRNYLSYILEELNKKD